MAQKRRKYNHPIMCYVETETHFGLERLHQMTRIPKSVLMREALADLLKKYHVNTQEK